MIPKQNLGGMKMKKFVSVLLVSALLLTVCASVALGRDEQHLVVVTAAFPVLVDPGRTNDLGSSLVNRQWAETLVMFATPAFDIVPHLAESWHMPDPQTLIMNLRRGVKFHNGDEMRASDVAFSLMRAIQEPRVRFILEMIESVDVIDDYTAQINLNIPFAPILGHLTHLGASILPERVVTELGDDFHNSPIGTGPFMVNSIVLGDHVELIRHENYWGTPPTVDRLTIRTIPEAANRLIEVETGAAHIAMGIAAHNLPRLQEDPNLDYNRMFALRNHHMGMNLNHPALADIRVRQAIRYAIDKPALVQTVYQGTGRVINSVMVGIPGTVEFEPIEYNLDRARELMAEAGFADGLTLSLWCNVNNQWDTDKAVIIQSMLAEIDIDVEIVASEFSVFMPGANAGRHDLFLHGHTNPPADPDYALIRFHSSSVGGTGNRYFMSHSEVDRLIEQGRIELDPAARLEIYAEAQRLLWEHVPAIWISQGEDLLAIAPGLGGFINFPIATPRFWTVTLPE